MKVHITKLICDRCKVEYVTKGNKTICDLSFMVLHNGSGSSRSDDKKDLCEECAYQFLMFMKGEAAEAVDVVELERRLRGEVEEAVDRG